MDQDAFRSLLSAPRQASSSSRTVLGGAAPKRGWALKQKQGPRNEKPKDEPTSSAPAFAPRQHRKRQEQNGEAASSAYKDRAAMRRQGVDDEYKGVEKLLEDFERRKAEAGEEDADKIEATRAYLGGDAEHSILVKGLDYALLAARKAELAREQDEGMEDELDELGKGLGRRPEGKSKGKEEVRPEEKLGNRFKSIAQRKAEEEAAKGEKKQKTKKKKKDKHVDDVSQAPAEDTSRGPIKEETQEGDEPPIQPILPMPAAKAPTPEPEIEEDIFADAGMYDLGAGGESDGEEEEESALEAASERDERNERGQEARRKETYSRPRSTSRSSFERGSYDEYNHRRRDNRHDDRRGSGRHDDRWERDYGRHDDRRERGHDRYDARRRSPSLRYRDEDYRRYSYRSRSMSRSRSPYGRSREARRRSPSPPPHRHHHRSPLSRSPSPHHATRRSRSPSTPLPSESPPHKRARPRSRSVTPSILFAAPPRSASPSGSENEAIGIPTKLVPLSSSAMADVGGFLAAEASAAKAEQRRIKKAQWRARQGLATQEGTDMEQLTEGKRLDDKQKQNREYQLVMNQMKKEGGGEGGAGVGPSSKPA